LKNIKTYEVIMEIKIYEKGKRDSLFYKLIGPIALQKNIASEMHDLQYGGIYDDPDNAVWFFALEGKTLLRFCSLFDREKELFFDNCYVIPEHRNKRIGIKLFTARLDYTKSIQGNRHIKGITKNEIQYRIYLKYGFELASKKGKYYWLKMLPEVRND